MNREIYTNFNRINLIAALIFLCSMFSFSTMAQDKPMEAKSLAGLIKDLKEVVSKNARNQNDAQLIGKKWDARKDLTGKTKSAVINLLYNDVKTVIKDSGVQYQIYSIFSFYKQIPDEQFSGKTKSPLGTNSKSEASTQLTNLTCPYHPYVGIEDEIAKLPGTKEIKAEEERVRKFRIEGFDEALKLNNKLTADQKVFVRANYDTLIKIADKITEDALEKNFASEQWIMEGLDKTYSAKFTLKELNNLLQFLDSDKGVRILTYIRQTEMEQLITGNGGKLNYTADDKAEYDKFAATPLGKKFIVAFLIDAVAYEKRKENAARLIPNSDGFAIYEPANLNKLFNKFVAENYKK